ncbi:MAG: YggS family pyridoxal phosphate-dependent enzyme [Gammaproteobacteria bacterium]|nr:MAG: YggS family pyridoxal phosphate-dependent enzyme [Gammaproteobacteria bacterium]
MNLKQNITKIKSDIKNYCHQYSRNQSDVLLLSVSKTKPLEQIISAHEIGLKHFGENYLQDALPKIKKTAELNLNLIWHFIGAIQSNKTADIANNFSWVHCLDRAKIINRLAQQRDESLPPLNCCIQVNFDDDDDKNGLTDYDKIVELGNLINSKKNLRLRGIMGIGKNHNDFTAQKKSLQKLKNIYKNLQKEFDVDILSMGMSGDLEAAIATGSTCVRIGSDIFGKRQ